MYMIYRDDESVEGAAAAFEIIEGLESALDLSYRRFVHVASKHWQRASIGIDPSDSCVTVRINKTSAPPIRGSGFLSSSKRSAFAPLSGMPYPQLVR